MARLASVFALLVAACGGTESAPSAPRDSHAPAVEVPVADTSDARDAVGDAPFRGHTPSPPRAFQISIPRRNGQVQFFEVTSSGDLFQWVTPYERPGPPAVVAMRSDWTLREISDDEIYFALRREDGALLPTRYEPDMHCSAHRDGRVRCRCDGHTPIVDVTYSIAGEDLMVTNGIQEATFGRVTPAPANAAEKLRALIIIADWTYSRDDHGDSAHDIDD